MRKTKAARSLKGYIIAYIIGVFVIIGITVLVIHNEHHAIHHQHPIGTYTD